MAQFLGMIPQDWFYTSFSLLIFIWIILSVALTFLAILAIKGFMKLQENINDGYKEIKRKFDRTFRILDVFLDIFGEEEVYDDEEPEEEEVYVLKKKKK